MAVFQHKETKVLHDAVRLPGDARLPMGGGWIDAKRNDWLTTNNETNEQEIFSPTEFETRFTPATVEAQRLVMEPESDEAV